MQFSGLITRTPVRLRYRSYFLYGSFIMSILFYDCFVILALLFMVWCFYMKYIHEPRSKPSIFLMRATIKKIYLREPQPFETFEHMHIIQALTRDDARRVYESYVKNNMGSHMSAAYLYSVDQVHQFEEILTWDNTICA